ncbi:SDR family NAD(P)-dependent oxidoreductase [Frankia sp. Mgl5]|nr:SDR family NAD(P)-dependent oxidoreductase [Frankia sp. Mgl5]MCK9928599.1 SDR family NAD(P)-dependent oxidoreductase [Frankia sp. Mgl5]
MDERTALVVGGTSGIGLATARRLQALGATVHVVGRGRQRLDDVAASDPALIGHRADGGNRAEIAAVLEAIDLVDWLIITLSGQEGVGPIVNLDLDVLRRAFDAKFWAHLTVLQAALPHLTPSGSITLLGSDNRPRDNAGNRWHRVPQRQRSPSSRTPPEHTRRRPAPRQSQPPTERRCRKAEGAGTSDGRWNRLAAEVAR